MVKTEWLKTYDASDPAPKSEMVFQSWDTANKPTELSDYSVGTTWGVEGKHLYLRNVYRKRVGYPELKRAVREQAEMFGAQTVLIEDRASGAQLIQDLVNEGMHAIKKYEPTMDKIMRMHSVTGTIENGFVHVPDKAPWLGEYLLELTTFPKGKYDDQVDSTSQALDWFKRHRETSEYGLIEYLKREAAKLPVPESRPCAGCNGVMNQHIAGGLRCERCGARWFVPEVGIGEPVRYPTRTDFLNNGFGFGRWRMSNSRFGGTR
jgi:predicted phage terminase large subunit-like protein